MTLLSHPWQLHDVDDVEALLVTAVSRSGFARELQPVERDDLVCDLFRVAWQLAGSFDATRGSFSTFLYGSAQRRAIDWHRREFGRTTWRFTGRPDFERRRPELVSVDEHTGLLDFVSAGAGDPAGGGDASLVRLLDVRGGSRARDLETLGLAPARRAP